MLKLKELRWSGIGRFVEEQIVVFDSLGSLVQVDGQNNNTKGSSGAGKSTVFHALDYLFGISNIPNTVLKCRYSEDSMFVKGTFDFDGVPLIITRGKKLSIELDGKITTGSSKITEEELDRIIAIPRDLFRKMLHKRQKEGGFFLQMTPSEINSFLTDCLGLGEFKKKLEKLDVRITELTEKKTNVSRELSAKKSGLTATATAIVSLGAPPDKEVDQQAILDLKGKADKSARELSAIQISQRLEMETLNLSRPQIDQKLFDASLREAYEKELKDLSKDIRDKENKALSDEHNRQSKLNASIAARKAEAEKLSYQIRTAENVKTEAAKLALEIKKIRESICPTCEQTWLTENAKCTEAAHLEKLKNFKEQILLGAKASEAIKIVQADIAAWTIEIKPKEIEKFEDLKNREKELSSLITQEKAKETDFRNAQHYLNKVKLDQFAEQQKILTDRQTLALAQCRGQSDVDRRALEAAVGKLKAYEEARTRHERQLATLKAQEEAYKREVDEFTLSSVQVHNELLIVEELKRGVKSYLSCSFDEALESISDNATKLIRNIPNMANATLQLSGTKETQEGKIKEEVNAIIHMDGEENIDIRSLCGGERTAMDLAIDLSVIDLIESKANKGINIFILDEPFNGLDTVCIEMALEVLKNSNTNKRLVIVDHNPEIKQIVGSRLLVVRDGLTSRITQL